jgi:hypothetical protein
MSVRRANDSRPDAPSSMDASEAPAAPKAPARSPRTTTPAERMGVLPPRSTEEAEERYLVARDAWIASMHKANSGRSADLATLAITQEAYVQAMAEVERWRSGVMVAFDIEPEAKLHDIETAVGQEFAWRRVHERATKHLKHLSPLGRLARRLTGRGD